MKTVNMRSKWECVPCGNIITVMENNRTTKESVNCSCGNITTEMVHREVLEIH
tara:strand:+ start:315 stop:473 length:159 start_codon:yes stop_codon:yes gene_type:complete